MNKIQSISEEARKRVPQGIPVDQWIEQYNQEFAELIVRECIQVVNAVKSGHMRSDWDMSLDFAVKTLEEHFGCEQSCEVIDAS